MEERVEDFFLKIPNNVHTLDITKWKIDMKLFKEELWYIKRPLKSFQFYIVDAVCIDDVIEIVAEFTYERNWDVKRIVYGQHYLVEIEWFVNF